MLWRLLGHACSSAARTDAADARVLQERANVVLAARRGGRHAFVLEAGEHEAGEADEIDAAHGLEDPREEGARFDGARRAEVRHAEALFLNHDVTQKKR